jgi:hypothetical protein
MHLKKWCGTPRDRRIDRRKVAIAAFAALFLFAALPAQAGITDFEVDEALSSLVLSGTVDLSDVFGQPLGTTVVPYTPQAIDFNPANTVSPALGDTSHYTGHAYFDVPAGLSGVLSMPDNGAGYIIATGSGVGAGGAPPTPGTHYQAGGWIPEGDGYGGVKQPPGPYSLGQYGITVSAVGAFVSIWDLNLSPSAFWGGALGNPTNSSAISSGVFPVGGMMMGTAKGYQALTSGLGDSFTDLSDAAAGNYFPVPLGGDLDISTGSPAYTPNATIGTWDGTTLTINVNGSVTYLISDGQDGDPLIPTTQTWDGTLVFHKVIPEPSSMLLLGFGAVGLLGYVWRKRRSA